MWSSEEESKLLSWQGTVKELAAILGRSENSIRSKSKKLGKYFNTFPEDTDTQRFLGKVEKLGLTRITEYLNLFGDL